MKEMFVHQEEVVERVDSLVIEMERMATPTVAVAVVVILVEEIMRVMVVKVHKAVFGLNTSPPRLRSFPTSSALMVTMVKFYLP